MMHDNVVRAVEVHAWTGQPGAVQRKYLIEKLVSIGQILGFVQLPGRSYHEAYLVYI
jgi:hypothetical protein